MPEVQVKAEEIKQRRTYDRGRVHLGPEYADAEVTVAVIDADDEDGAETDESGA